MKRAWVSAAGMAVRMCGLVLLAGVSVAPLTGQTGERIFRESCAACHTIGEGPLIGPDLAGLSDRRSEEWIIDFVQSSQTVIASGDSTAVALSERYPGVMPDWPLSDDEVRGVIAYVREAGSASAVDVAREAGPVGATGAAGAGEPASGQPSAPSPEQVRSGRSLFQGTVRFAEGGPSCNSCHDVRHEAVLAGGALAVDLTDAASRLGPAGVRGIIANPPFPVMRRAYRDRPLTEDEVAAISTFLREAGARQSAGAGRPWGRHLIAAGIAGSALLLGCYSLVWRRRKKASVRKAIYDRQMSST